MSSKRVYFFGDGKADGDASLRNLLGGKGANLAEMVQSGLPGPAGFTISTEVCVDFQRTPRAFPELKADVKAALARVEKVMDRRFGDATNPLLVSVRSGARVSMPGMMDTVLNLGLNDTDGRRPRGAQTGSPLRLRLLPAASSRCTATSSWASTRALRGRPGRRRRKSAASRWTRTWRVDDLKDADRRVQGM